MNPDGEAKPPADVVEKARQRAIAWLQEGDGSRPLLSVHGRNGAWARTTRKIGCFATLVTFAAALFPGTKLQLPAPFTIAFVLGPTILVFLFSEAYRWARLGYVAFHRDMILFGKPAGEELVLWEDLVAYRDSDADFIVLIRAPGKSGIVLSVPTPDENVRTEVLALLDAKGLVRREE